MHRANVKARHFSTLRCHSRNHSRNATQPSESHESASHRATGHSFRKMTCAPPPVHPREGKNVRIENDGSVGVWGGTCTCPDGQVYLVGDENNACATMACENGVAGLCNHYFSLWAHRRVKCFLIPSPPPMQPPSMPPPLSPSPQLPRSSPSPPIPPPSIPPPFPPPGPAPPPPSPTPSVPPPAPPALPS
eukprot:7380920-Prymnesium_polylepis.1